MTTETERIQAAIVSIIVFVLLACIVLAGIVGALSGGAAW